VVLSTLLLSGAGLAAVAPAAAQAASASTAAGASVSVLQAAPDVYMLTVDGVNIGVEVGPDGPVVVDTGPASASQAVVAAIRKLSDKPIRFVIDTSADADLVGGNGSVANAGLSLAMIDPFSAGQTRQLAGRISSPDAGTGAPIIARQAVLVQLVSQTGADYSNGGLPSDTFTRPQDTFYVNDGPVEVVSLPGAHTDGDSAVRFDRADAVVAGAVFDQTRFPVIDLAHGGSVQGEINALNQLLNTLVFGHTPVLANTGGTVIMPSRGPLSDQDDLVGYRDMVATVSARIQYYIAQGKTFQQIQAADPAQGFHSRYGSDSGSWTTSDFIEAVYKSLMAERKTHHGRQG
jgi:glyoxylase-like metal-dependent hydrolase (beta-lactamase superfamily II)